MDYADVHFGSDVVQCANVCRFVKMDLMCLNSDLLNVHDDCILIVAGQYVKWFVILMHFGYGSDVVCIMCFIGPSNWFTWAWHVA